MRAGFDFGALIWVAFFIFSFAISAIEKRNRAKREKDIENQPEFPPVVEVFPPITAQESPNRIPKNIQEKIDEQRFSGTIRHKDSQEHLNSPETLGRPESLERIDTHFTTTASRKISPKRVKSTPKIDPKPTNATTEPQENTNEIQTANDITDRFNLRDAVIYAEILKPKFDE